MNSTNYIISIQTFNSMQNIPYIMAKINKFNIKIKEIVIIDNCSTNFSINQKKNFFYKLNQKYNFKITLILNKQNYGIGGSFKILFGYLNKKNFSYLINLQSSGRYDVNEALKNFVYLKTYENNLEYYLLSRFLKPKNTKNYSYLRKIANYIFIKLTKLLTKSNFSDPGMSIFMIKKNICEILINPKFTSLTNGSHFPHLMNVILYNYIKNYKELEINWKEGNVKSHLNAISYPLELLINLIFYKIKGSFIKLSKITDFKYEIINKNN